MKRLKYHLTLKNEGADDSVAWWEPISGIVEDDVKASDHARAVIKRFNDTLQPGESRREFVKITKANTTKL